MSNAHFWLSEKQFSKLDPHLPSDTRGVPRVGDRRVISGIVHVLEIGGRWVDAPETHGPHKTLYNRFVRWAEKGIWIDIFHALASAGGPPARVLIDSTAVRSRTSGALQRDMISSPRISLLPHHSLQRSATGYKSGAQSAGR